MKQVTDQIVCDQSRHNLHKTFRNLFGPKYNGKYLRLLLMKQLGDLTIKDTLTNLVIPAFDIKYLQPVIFTTTDVCMYICISCSQLQLIGLTCGRISYIVCYIKIICRQRKKLTEMQNYLISALALQQHLRFSRPTILKPKTNKEK